MELYCGMCSRMMPSVAYSAEGGGYICDPCDLKALREVRQLSLRTSPTERPCCVEAYARGYNMGHYHGKNCPPTSEPVKPPRLSCGCLIVQTAEGQIGAHRDGCTEERLDDPHPEATKAYEELRKVMPWTKEHCQREAHCRYPFEATCGCKCVQCV